MLLSEIAQVLGGQLSGNGDIDILRVANIEEAGSGDITFLANLKYKKHLLTTEASAVLIAENSEFEELHRRTTPLAVVRVTDPYAAFLRLVDRFHPAAQPLPPGIHRTAIIAATASIGTDTAIGPYVVVGERSRIGAQTALYPGVVIGDDAVIGDGSVLYPNVTVREGCRIGAHAIIHAGAAIGSDGFGFARQPDKSYQKIAQRGLVVIGDDVEIGANCTIDRATFGETRIANGVKLDNLVHVAHNVVIGEHTAIAAQAGISGSTKVGDHCGIGGQAGLTGHIVIADDVTIGAQSGVPKSIPEQGATYMGYPAREIHEWWRMDGALRQLPELLFQIRSMQRRIEELEHQLKPHISENQ